MDVDGRIHRGEDAPMPSGMKTDNRRIHVFQIEGCLNFLVLLHVVRRIADAIEYMEFNECLASTQHEREGRLRIEGGGVGSARVDRRREHAVHDRLALRADEAQPVTWSLLLAHLLSSIRGGTHAFGSASRAGAPSRAAHYNRTPRHHHASPATRLIQLRW